MNLTWNQPRAARRTAAGLVLGGALGGGLGPALQVGLGPAAPGAALALGLALGGALLRGGGPPAGLLVGLAGVLGGLAALLAGGPAPAGLGHALLGLGVGLVLSSSGRGATGRALEAIPHAAGALLGGIAAGALAAAPALHGLPLGVGPALLGGALGLGVALAELGRGARLIPGAAPSWARQAMAQAGPEARPLFAAALDAHARLLGALARGGPSVRASLTGPRGGDELAGQLLESALRAAAEVDSCARALTGLVVEDPALAGHAELDRARAELRKTLAGQRDAAREVACARTAELVRLVVIVSAESAAQERDRADLETRLRELERTALLGGNP